MQHFTDYPVRLYPVGRLDFDSEGLLVRRLASCLLTRPSEDNATHFYWDGRDQLGHPVTEGTYILAAETRLGSKRCKALAEVTISEP